MKHYPCVPLSDKTVSGYMSEQDCRSRRFRYSDFTEVVTESRNYMVGFRNQWTKDDARLGGTAE